MCSNRGIDLVTECVGFSELPALCLKNVVGGFILLLKVSFPVVQNYCTEAQKFASLSAVFRFIYLFYFILFYFIF